MIARGRRPDQDRRRRARLCLFLRRRRRVGLRRKGPGQGAGKAGRGRVADAVPRRLAAADPFDAARLEQRRTQFVGAEGIKIGDIIHAIRVAVTGQGVGLGLFDSLAILGPAEPRPDRADVRRGC